MHEECIHFLSRIAKRFPDNFGPGCRVVEFGSRDINGTPRNLFSQPKEYVGIDFHEGDGVDVVGVCHEWVPPEKNYDVVVSTEMLEHDPYWEETLRHAVDLLRPGGVLVFTCASIRRSPHHLNDSPIVGYYGGRSTDEVLDVLSECADWQHLHANYQRNGLDLIFWGYMAE